MAACTAAFFSSSGSAASIALRPVRIFSHTRGTPKKRLGRTSPRAPTSRVGSETKWTWPLTVWGTYMPKTRSAMCAIGRYDSEMPVVSRRPAWSRELSISNMMFSWVNCTPFGGPVVPEVKSTVNESVGLIALIRACNSACLARSWRSSAPRAWSSAKVGEPSDSLKKITLGSLTLRPSDQRASCSEPSTKSTAGLAVSATWATWVGAKVG